MAEFTVCIKDAEGKEIEAYELELDYKGAARALDRAVYDALCNELHLYYCEFCNKMGNRDDIVIEEGEDGCVSCPKCAGEESDG